MALSAADFLASLLKAVPEAQPVVDDLLIEQEGELLLHLLLSDLGPLANAAYEQGDADLLKRLLAVIDTGLTDGDEYVENAVAVSFVEHGGYHWDPEMQPFIATWPNALQAEAQRQKDWRPYRDSTRRRRWWQRP